MMKSVLVLLAVCLHFTNSQNWELVWSDEFDGDSIDFDKWDHELTMWGSGNGEFQTYTDDPTNSYVQDGYLWLKPTLLRDNTDPRTGEPFGDEVFEQNNVFDLEEIYGRCTHAELNGCDRRGRDIPPIASARLRSYDRFAFQYGRVEVMARMPVGDWMWPAIWFLPEYWVFGGWPESGEVDLVETIGNEDYICEEGYRDINHMGSAMHWGTGRDDNRFDLTHDGRDDPENDYGNNMHEYVLEWTANGLSFLVDGATVMIVPDPLIDNNPTWSGFYDFGAPWNYDPGNIWNSTETNDVLMAPFDQPMHFLLNVAVGGTNNFIPDDCVYAGGEPSRVKNWRNGWTQEDGQTAFYDFKDGFDNDGWYSTWLNGESTVSDRAAMQVDYIRVYQQVE